MSAAVRRDTDSSGRGIFATDREWARWEAAVFDMGFRPTITQGPWQRLNGGGAPDSAGYHDFGGTFDLRVWDRTAVEVARMIRVLRNNGCVAWLRNREHGGFSDPHIHFVMAGEPNLSSGAAWQVSEYRAGRDGLASRGSDYHPRPSPLVLAPTEEMFMPTLNEIRAAWQDDIAKLEAKVDAIPAEVWKVKGSTIKPDERTPTYGRMLEETHNRAKQARDAHDEPPPAA